MEELKKKVRTRKRVLTTIAIITAIIFVVSLSTLIPLFVYDINLAAAVSLMVVGGVALIGFFVDIFYLFIKHFLHYEYNGINIDIYIGAQNHYLYVNNTLVDQYVCEITFSGFDLKYQDNNVNIIANIGMDNNVNVKVNGKNIPLIKKY